MVDLTTHKLRTAAMFLAVAVLLSAGCAAIRLGYETLPTWAFFQLDRYWKLDAAQSDLVRTQLADYQRWHRQNELPQYARFLESVRERVRAQIDVSEVGRWREAADARWRVMAKQAAAPLAELALTLRPEQVDRMKKRLAEQNTEYRRKQLPTDPRERQSKRIERIEDRAEFFFGRLTDAQHDIVRRHVEASSTNDDEALYAERLARQQAVIGALERIVTSKPARDDAQRQVETLLAQLWKPRDAQRAAVMERSAAAADALTVALVNSASPAQKTKMAQRLSTWMSDFEHLAGQ